MRNRIGSLILSFVFFYSAAFSHQGGHGSAEKGQLRQWFDVNSRFLAEGSFLFAKDDQVIIEDAAGKKIALKLETLSCKDLYYSVAYSREIEKINRYDGLDNSRPVLQPRVDYNSTHLLLILLVCSMTSVLIYFHSKQKLKLSYTFLAMSVSFASCVYLVACSKNASEVLKSGTNDPTVMAQAFAPYDALVDTHYDDTYFYVESNGIPDHQMMVGITAWIAQVPIPQYYTGNNAWKVPLKTKYAASPVSLATELRKGAVAIACNGIPVFNPLNASGLVSENIGELDAFGGHSGRGDDYHYHTAPLHLEATSGAQPIAYALDGYAMYGSKEPDGSSMKTLDKFNGHELNGTYHYHGTSAYPFVMTMMRGAVTLDGTKPEDMIMPQPSEGNSLRGDPHPINGQNLIITNMQARSQGVGYILSYTIGGKPGSVEYYWDSSGLYTFIFHDVDGTTLTQTFQR